MKYKKLDTSSSNENIDSFTLIKLAFGIIFLTILIVSFIFLILIYKKNNEIFDDLTKKDQNPENNIFIATGDSTQNIIDNIKQYLQKTNNVEIFERINSRFCSENSFVEFNSNKIKTSICNSLSYIQHNIAIFDKQKSFTEIATSSENAMKLSLQSNVVRSSISATMPHNDFLAKICSPHLINSTLALYLGDTTNCIVTNLELVKTPVVSDIITSIKNNKVFLDSSFFTGQLSNNQIKFVTSLEDSDAFINLKDFLVYNNNNEYLDESYVTYTSSSHQHEILQNIAANPHIPQISVVSLSQLKSFYQKTTFELNEIKLGGTSCYQILSNQASDVQIYSNVNFFNFVKTDVGTYEKYIEPIIFLTMVDLLQNNPTLFENLSIIYPNTNLLNDFFESQFLKFWCASSTKKMIQ